MAATSLSWLSKRPAVAGPVALAFPSDRSPSWQASGTGFGYCISVAVFEFSDEFPALVFAGPLHGFAFLLLSWYLLVEIHFDQVQFGLTLWFHVPF